MDFTQAALLGAAVYVVTQWVKQLLSSNWRGAVVQGFVIVAAIGVSIIVAHSTWGATQHVNGVELDRVDAPGLVVVGLMLAGVGTALHQLVNKAIPNIGQNVDQPLDQ